MIYFILILFCFDFSTTFLIGDSPVDPAENSIQRTIQRRKMIELRLPVPDLPFKLMKETSEIIKNKLIKVDGIDKNDIDDDGHQEDEQRDEEDEIQDENEHHDNNEHHEKDESDSQYHSEYYTDDIEPSNPNVVYRPEVKFAVKNDHQKPHHQEPLHHHQDSHHHNDNSHDSNDKHIIVEGLAKDKIPFKGPIVTQIPEFGRVLNAYGYGHHSGHKHYEPKSYGAYGSNTYNTYESFYRPKSYRSFYEPKPYGSTLYGSKPYGTTYGPKPYGIYGPPQTRLIYPKFHHHHYDYQQTMVHPKRYPYYGTTYAASLEPSYGNSYRIRPSLHGTHLESQIYGTKYYLPSYLSYGSNHKSWSSDRKYHTDGSIRYHPFQGHHYSDDDPYENDYHDDGDHDDDQYKRKDHKKDLTYKKNLSSLSFSSGSSYEQKRKQNNKLVKHKMSVAKLNPDKHNGLYDEINEYQRIDLPTQKPGILSWNSPEKIIPEKTSVKTLDVIEVNGSGFDAEATQKQNGQVQNGHNLNSNQVNHDYNTILKSNYLQSGKSSFPSAGYQVKTK